MWQFFLALPLVTKAILLLGLSGVALFGWLKRKTISQASSAVADAAQSKLWVWLDKKIPNRGSEGVHMVIFFAVED